MRIILSVVAVCSLVSCGGEPSKVALPASVCRAQLIQRDWPRKAHSPQIIATSSLSALVGEQDIYQLFWLQEGYLYHALRSFSSQEDPIIKERVSAFRAISHQDKALLAYATERGLFLTFDNTFSQRIEFSEKNPIESIALAAQGYTAAIVYTAQTPEGLQAYLQTVDLCPFFRSNTLCYTNLFDPEQAEVPGKFKAVSLGAADPLFHGALSIAPLGDKKFILSMEAPRRTKKIFILDREDNDKTLQTTEVTLLPDDTYPLPGVIPLVSFQATGQTFAFYTPDSIRLRFRAVDEDSARPHIQLKEKGALRRFAAVSASLYGDVYNFGALWFGPGPLQRGTRQLSFALFSTEGQLREAPFTILPGEDIDVADMATLNKTNSLSFGVFYQHEDPNIGLGLIEIECAK